MKHRKSTPGHAGKTYVQCSSRAPFSSLPLQRSPRIGHLRCVNAVCLYLSVSVPEAFGSVIFFTLALIGVTFPVLATIITAVAPAAHRGAVLGTYVAISTLPGLIAPLVTGLIIQAVGRNVASGFSHAYLLASLLLLIGGVAFLAFVRPDDQKSNEKTRRTSAHAHS